MKTKLLGVALFVSAALLASAQAGGGLHGGGGGGGPSFRGMPGGGFGGSASFRSMPMRSFSGNRTIYSGQRFSSVGPRSPGSMEFRPRFVNWNAGSIRARQFAQGNNNRVDRVPRFANAGNQSLANARPERNGQFRNGQLRNGNATLRSDWHNHVFAQHSANWHRDWDRHHDHFFHGHRFVFIDGFWWGFDLGFDPWWPWWWDYPYYGYGYPYGYGYYPYGYGYNYDYDYGDGYGYNYNDSGAYDDQSSYQNSYGDQAAHSAVAAAQERVAREGYYRGQIDGVFGSETRAAIAEYQSKHGLRVTGALTNETLAALGLRRVASY
jgi:putative peptidoglycan binding protein